MTCPCAPALLNRFCSEGSDSLWLEVKKTVLPVKAQSCAEQRAVLAAGEEVQLPSGGWLRS